MTVSRAAPARRRAGLGHVQNLEGEPHRHRNEGVWTSGISISWATIGPI